MVIVNSIVLELRPLVWMYVRTWGLGAEGLCPLPGRTPGLSDSYRANFVQLTIFPRNAVCLSVSKFTSALLKSPNSSSSPGIPLLLLHYAYFCSSKVTQTLVVVIHSLAVLDPHGLMGIMGWDSEWWKQSHRRFWEVPEIMGLNLGTDDWKIRGVVTLQDSFVGDDED